MSQAGGLHDYLERSAQVRPEHPAVVEADGSAITYAELAALAYQVRDRLQSLGVRPAARVGIWMRKLIDAVAAIFGTLEAGCAYVPVDPEAPAARNAYVFTDCRVAAIFVQDCFAAALRAELQAGGGMIPALLVVRAVGGGRGLRACLGELDATAPAPAGTRVATTPEALAYVLYTSGSTGRPKGVMLTHGNATSFVDWCSDTLQPAAADRFSAHAPLHFDLSILDLFVSIKHGATLVLIGEALGKEPSSLAEFIATAKISIWYSAPSILNLLGQRGELEEHDYSHLRLVLFAGEVFPVAQLRALWSKWRHPTYYNLYGPTETNVCTFYRLPAVIPEQRVEPFPIGKVCSHLQDLVIDPAGEPVLDGGEGELCIAGASVMAGYWNDPAGTERRFLQHGARRWYRTGDLVRRDEGGDYVYLGRHDRMVKKRGYRVELQEIEVRLSQHPQVREAAVVALPHAELGLLVKAHLGVAEGKRISVVQLKQFCADLLPVYMVPDQFAFHAELPRTSTGKVDYQTLQGLG